MRLRGSQMLVLLSVAVMLAACGGSKTKREDAGAAVEDRGLSSDEMEAGPDTRSQGLDDEAGFTGSALDAPSNALSVRVIYFEYDSSQIQAEYRPVLEAHANYLAARPNASLTLEGHADERGSREYNLALGEQRAQSVRRLMALLGASAGQLRTTSYGEERPAVEGHDEEAYSRNRRVELVY